MLVRHRHGAQVRLSRINPTEQRHVTPVTQLSPALSPARCLALPVTLPVIAGLHDGCASAGDTGDTNSEVSRNSFPSMSRYVVWGKGHAILSPASPGPVLNRPHRLLPAIAPIGRLRLPG